MSEQEETQNAGAVSPALPDGIGLTLDDVRALLAKEHETIVPKDDPMLMIVTLLNAYLGEVDKLHARHGKALGGQNGRLCQRSSGGHGCLGRATFRVLG